MRRIVAFDKVSADGYFTTGDGNMDWAIPEPELDQSIASNMGGPGALLFGRKTYEMFESFWPHALDDSDTAPNPHAAGQRSPEMKAFAVWINEAEKLVFSRTRKDFSWKNTRHLRELTPKAVASLKAEKGADLLIFGSGQVVSQLSEHGLVDEYWFVVSPLLLGSGRPLVSGLAKSRRLQLLEAKAYPEGNVSVRYAPRK
jgi:dihydrofolate reductase